MVYTRLFHPALPPDSSAALILQGVDDLVT